MIKNLFQNQGAFTPFAPVYSIPFWNAELLSSHEIEFMVSKILSKEEEIIKNNPHLAYDGGTGLGSNSLTAKFAGYNILQWDNEGEDYVVRKFKAWLHDAIGKMCEYVNEDIMELKPWAQCWANVLRKGEKINPHQHSGDAYSFLSGNVCLQADGTSTVYQNPFSMNAVALKNVPGHLTLFPEYIVHWTTQNQSDIVRVSLGIDIVTEYSLLNAPDRNRDIKHFERLY
jgi:hypothetical protein